MSDVILPGLFTLCALLGVPHAKCAAEVQGGFGLYALAAKQTDPAKWYLSTASWPNKSGKPTGCEGAIPIGRYRIFDGSYGTTWACRFPKEDDAITENELGIIAMEAHRLNAIPKKTYSDHAKAMALKSMAKILP